MIEKLYSDILYAILHNVGYDVELPGEQTDLFAYLQRAFHMEDEKHNALLESARCKDAPNILLNVEVIEVKDLHVKDANGLCNLFCTLYLSSAQTLRYNTSVKSETLTPLWEEHFSLFVENARDDVLVLEVRDSVKGVKGLTKWMMQDSELIGSTKIPVWSIPASGYVLWCPLEKKMKTKKQGNVKVKLSFSTGLNSQVSSQEYRQLLRQLLLHELDQSKGDLCQWSGNFSTLAKDILTKHAMHSSLSSSDELLAQWVEFACVNSDHSLSFTLFAHLAERLARSLLNGTLSDEQQNVFWEGTKKLLPSCINVIRNVRKLTASDKHTQDQITAILRICSALQSKKVPEDCDLFPASVYGLLNQPTNGLICDIKFVITDAIIQGAADRFADVVESNGEKESAAEGKLRHLIKVVTQLEADIQMATKFYDKLFLGSLQLPCAKTLYAIYESKLCKMAEQEVRDTCGLLRTLKFDELGEDTEKVDTLVLSTTLFELYRGVQRFAELGKGLEENTDAFCINQFHQWFHRGVEHWQDIALYRALQGIKKAVELDNLQPVGNNVKWSSSAVDTLTMIFNIKTFWKQLSSTDIICTFLPKIIDDVFRCCTYYADMMTARVAGFGEMIHPVYGSGFYVTSEWCLAINNIDYVRNYILYDKVDDIIRALSDFQSPAAADHCNQTLLSIIDNARESLGNKILNLQETVVDKMTPSISQFLLERAELLNQESNIVDRLMQYLDENLLTLHDQLNDDNFQSMLNIIWETVEKILYDLVGTNFKKRRPKSFFSNLHLTLQTLMDIFKKGENGKSDEGNKKEEEQSTLLQKVIHLLRLHGMKTSELIHQYHLERALAQETLPVVIGSLTVRAHFVDQMIRIELMNARNLKAKDTNGSCDPYVNMLLLPQEKFISAPKHKSKTQKKTTFPLFDEVFSIQLTAEQRQISNALIHFIVKDSDSLGDEFLGEAYLSFSKLEESDELESLPQIHLTLHKPAEEPEILKVLKHRLKNRQARGFVKQMKGKADAMP